ncbi:DUF3108 domain-containing protein [Noviherbaspirillum galbum]|uniref:DUF3108 domain-containing protein n=1 Tax=Noviherbaspirillum galbum TaxID=2709383 RepID=A0A6B3SYA1_9BURK|nr:DUF3108 domain-containing protein [Noviherbaspirillum galbum]NEX64296.1 DUF3108 domain-containing protein [Noviherbaspirillum galbum]
MPPFRQPEFDDPPRGRRLRALVVTAAIALLHAVAFSWLNLGPAEPARPPAEAPLVMIDIPRPAEPPPAPAAPPTKPRPARRHPAPAKSEPPSPPPPPAPALAEADAPALPPAVESTPVQPTDDALPAAPAAMTSLPAAEDAAKPPVAEVRPSLRFAPPPPAELQYDVTASRDNQNWHGKGEFRWENRDGSYAIHGEASVTLFFKINVLQVSSEGLIGENGLEPVRYSEKPFRRSMMNTHFQRAVGRISFSASESTAPWESGEQDRISTIWQLASIGRADPAQFVVGEDLAWRVAGTRDSDLWTIKVIGQEDIDTDEGKRHTWHVSRAPRPGSYDQALDIWLAPGQDWQPVKIRYTYANGDWLQLSLTRLTPLAPSGNS